MKTSQIARGIVGALSLAGVIGAIGCSADAGYEGAAGDGEIGETSQALSTATLDNAPFVHDGAASCEVLVNNKNLLLVAGGLDAAGSATQNVGLMDPSLAASSQWLARTLTGSLGTARAFSQMKRVPGSDNECLLAGGLTAHLGSDAVSSDLTKKLTVTEALGAYTVTVTAGPTGFTDRGKFMLAQCGTNTLVAVAGEDNGAAKDTVQYWHTSAGAWATPANHTALATARKQFGFAPAQEGTTTRFVVGGGDASGPSNDLEYLVFSTGSGTECSTLTRFQDNNRLGQNRNRVAAFPVSFTAGSPDVTEVLFVAGSTSTDDTNTSDKVTVTWSATPSGSRVAGPSLTNDVVFPTVVRVANFDYLVSGGQAFTSSTLGAAVPYVQRFSSGSFSAVSNLTGSRVHHVGEYLSTWGNAVVSGGESAASTELQTAEKIVP